jgi:hypothetical protein
VRPDVAHDGDASGGDAADGGGDLLAAFKLDRVARALLHQAARVLESLLGADVVAHEGHVADEVRPLDRPPHGAAMVDDVIHRDGERRVVPLDDVAEAVPDEDEVHPRLIDELGQRVVVGREGDDGAALALEFVEGVGGDWLDGRGTW